MRALALLVGFSLLFASAGCSALTGSGDRRSVSIYLIGVESNRLEAVQRSVPLSKAQTPHDTAIAAVEALMAADENGKKYSSLWGKMCGWGTGVKSIESRPSEGSVEVTLTGQGAALCDLSEEGYNLQVQQLVWTVVKNLEVAESSTVKVLGPSNYVWVEGATPDAAYVAANVGSPTTS